MKEACDVAFRRCNPRVPCRCDGTSFETPKSASFALPSRVRRMFPALTSWSKMQWKSEGKTKKASLCAAQSAHTG